MRALRQITYDTNGPVQHRHNSPPSSCKRARCKDGILLKKRAINSPTAPDHQGDEPMMDKRPLHHLQAPPPPPGCEPSSCVGHTSGRGSERPQWHLTRRHIYKQTSHNSRHVPSPQGCISVTGGPRTSATDTVCTSRSACCRKGLRSATVYLRVRSHWRCTGIGHVVCGTSGSSTA